MRLWRRNCSKALCAVLTLVAANILLVFYSTRVIHSWVLGNLHKEGALVAQRPSYLERDVHRSSKSYTHWEGNSYGVQAEGASGT